MEDGFEKNHEAIRDQIFNQNQKAHSRDTAINFAKNFILQHVLAGGFFPVENEWKQASDNVKRRQQDTEIQTYMGFPLQEKRKRHGAVSKLNRSCNGHTLSEALQHDLLLSMAGIEVSVNLNSTVVKGSAVTAKNGDLVNEQEWIRYIDSDGQECFGVFQKGYIIDKKFMMVDIKVAERIDGEEILNCQSNKIKNDRVILLSTSIIEKSVFVHDCKGGQCKIVQSLISQRIEQENISRKKKYLKHNNNHNHYLLNIYNIKQST